MGSRDAKTERILAVGELPGFFRQVADELEGVSRQGGGGQLGLSGFAKFKIRVKAAGERAEVKVKVKLKVSAQGHSTASPSASAPAKTGKVPYKELKKRIGKVFEGFTEGLKEGLLPTDDDLDRFYRDAKQMVSYEDKATPYYDEFMRAATGFRDACRKGDVSTVQETHRRLEELKKACHDRFK